MLLTHHLCRVLRRICLFIVLLRLTLLVVASMYRSFQRSYLVFCAVSNLSLYSTQQCIATHFNQNIVDMCFPVSKFQQRIIKYVSIQGG